MTEKWLIAPGESRVIDIERAQRLKIGLIAGQIDVIAHDEPGIRIEVHAVRGKELRIEHDGSLLEIDHPQLSWENFLEVFRNFTADGPRAEISVAVPRDTPLTLGVVSATALVSGLTSEARLNTVSGDIIVDTHRADLTINAVSGDVQVQGIEGVVLANSVSGDVAISGSPARVTVDTVSGAVMVDAASAIDVIAVNSVSAGATLRLPEGLAAKYSARSLAGRLSIDGVERTTSRPASYTGSTGELSGTFADVKFNSVSGDLTVLRAHVKEHAS